MDSDLKPLTWLHNIDILGQCGIEAGKKKSLVDLDDPTDYRTTDAKPPLSYSSLITKAIKSTAHNKMTLSQIYSWIRENHLYYQKADPAWQNSIRHNLSLNKCFVKIPRGKDEPGKGGFWSLDESLVGRCGSKRKKKKKAKTMASKDGFGGGGNSNSSRDQVRRIAKALRLEAWEKSSLESSAGSSSPPSGTGSESISFMLNSPGGDDQNSSNNNMMGVELPHLENNNDAKMANNNNMEPFHHHQHHNHHQNASLDDDVTCGFSLASNDQALASFSAVLNGTTNDDQHHHHHHQHGKLASGHEMVLGNGHMDLSDDGSSSQTGNPQLNGLNSTTTNNAPNGIIGTSSNNNNTIIVSPEDSCLDICQDVFITSHEEIVESEIIDSELILENVYWESVLDLDHLISIGEL